MVNERQKGIAQPAIILIVIGVIAAAAFLFFKGGILPQTSTLPPAKEPAEDDFSFVKDDNIRKHLKAQADQTRFRIRSSDALSLEGTANVSEIDAGSGKSNISSWLEQKGQKDFEMIIIDGVMYVKDYSDNSWWKQTLGKSQIDEFLIQNQINQPEDPQVRKMMSQGVKVDFVSLGQEPCPGSSNMSCFKYNQPGLDKDGSSDRIFWFDTKDYLLKREETGFGEYRSFIDYTYDNINITAPSKTKNVPEGDSIKFYYVGREGTPISRKELRDGGFSEEQLESVDY